MAKRKLTALAQVLVLVDELETIDKATLADYLRGKLPPRPKSTAQTAKQKSSRKSAAPSSTPNTEVVKDSALAVSGD